MASGKNYDALVHSAAFWTRTDRAWFQVKGKDRLTWLHNLTTNHVKTLQAGQGTYAFSLDIRGRILFDLNLLAGGDEVWLDLDRQFAQAAETHLRKYAIMEDVELSDQTAKAGRWAIIGPRSSAFLASAGLPEAINLPLLGWMRSEWLGQPCVLVRTDFCGEKAYELIGEAGFERASLDFLQKRLGHEIIEATSEEIQIRRIEGGIPWPGSEIAPEYLPAETRQLHRAVSSNKGCYLGQEVVERMRSRDVVARQLVGLRIEAETLPQPQSPLLSADGKPVGAVTSSCQSLALDAPIALAYVKTAAAAIGTRVTIHSETVDRMAEVVGLPFVPTAA